MNRPRHPRDDLEEIIRSLERAGWRIERGRYYKAYCPCGMHLKTIHLTPSSPHYGRNLQGWLKRTGCWKEET